jgi:tight adherence protein B
MDLFVQYVPVWFGWILCYIGVSILVGYVVFRFYSPLSGFVGRVYGNRRDEIVQQTYKMFMEFKAEQVHRYQLVGTIIMFLFGFILAWPNLIWGIPLGMGLNIFVLQVPRMVIQNMFGRRVRKFTLQLIDALTLMSNALRSGLNIPQALQLVSEEMPNPVAQEFGLVLREQKVGVPLEDALTALAQRIPNEDVDIFVTSVNILRETGGNLAETFDTITNTLRERLKLEQKISAMVAQGVTQGTIMVLLPFGLGIMLYMINPDQMTLMVTTPLGWGLLAFMMTLQAVGGFFIWKIIHIKV